MNTTRSISSGPKPSVAIIFSFAFILLCGAETAAHEGNAIQYPVDFLQTPLAFEPNMGQAAPGARYIARGPGYDISLESTGATIVIGAPAAKEMGRSIVRMRIAGAREAERVIGRDELPSRTNYYIGNDPDRWLSNVPNFGRVSFEGIYDGIDVVYYGNGRRLEYDFVVAPGVDPDIIEMAFDGAEGLKLVDGELVIGTAVGDLILHRPVSYQDINGSRRNVESAYVLDKGGRVRFELGAYDASQPLVIDPTLSYWTGFGLPGGSGNPDRAAAIAIRPGGTDLYVAGTVLNTLASGTGYDVFVTKFDSSGNLGYTTYVGGNGSDQGLGLAVDSTGGVFVAGATNGSGTFPFAVAASDAENGFVFHLNAAGIHLWTQLIAGSRPDRAESVALLPNGNIVVAGATQSALGYSDEGGTFQESSWNGYVAELTGSAPNMGTNWGHYIGRVATPVFQARALKVAVSSIQEIYVAATSNTGSGFVVKLFGQFILYSSPISGLGPLSATSVAPNIDESVYVTGKASGSGSGDAYVARLDTNGSQTGIVYLGGSGADAGLEIVRDGSGNYVVTGETASTNFPNTGAAQATNIGLKDAFIAKVSPALTLLYSTYAGTTADDTGTSVATASGFVYAAGYTVNGGEHSFVAKLDESGSPTTLTITSFTISPCVTSPCSVVGVASGTTIATATVVLSTALTGTLTLDNTDVANYLSFGPRTPAAAGFTTYTFPINYVPLTGGVGSGVTISLPVRAVLNDIPTAPQTLQLSGPVVAEIISLAIDNCSSGAPCTVSGASPTRIAQATVLLSDPVAASAVTLTGGGSNLSYGSPEPGQLANSFTIDIFPAAAVPAGTTVSLSIRAALNAVPAANIVNMTLVGPVIPTVTNLSINNCVGTACTVTGPSTTTPIATATVTLSSTLPSGVSLTLTGGSSNLSYGPVVPGAGNTYTIAIFPAAAVPAGQTISLSIRAAVNAVQSGNTVVMQLAGPPIPAVANLSINNCVLSACIVTGPSATPIATATVTLSSTLPSGVTLALTGGTGYFTYGTVVPGAPNTYTIAILPAAGVPAAQTVALSIRAAVNAVASGNTVAMLLSGPPFMAAGVQLAQTSVTGGATILNNTVTLNCVTALHSGLTVYLAANPPAGITIPATVSVPANACVSNAFQIGTSAVTTPATVAITASLISGVPQASTNLTVNPVTTVPTALDFAVFGAGNRTDSNSTSIGRNVEVIDGMVGSNRKVLIRSGSNVAGIRSGADTTVGREAGGEDDDEGTLGLTKGIVANGKVFLSGKSVVLGNVDGERILVGRKAAVAGNVVVSGKLDMTQDAAIQGNADATSTYIGRNVTIGGTLTLPVGVNPSGPGINNGSTSIGSVVHAVPKTPQAFPTILLPARLPYAASTLKQKDVTVARNATLNLNPGIYRDLDLKQNSTLNLTAGTYVFRGVTGNSDVKINMNVTAGDVIILAEDNVNFGRKLTVNVTGGTTERVYLETAGRFDTDAGSKWQGTVFSTKNNAPAQNGISIGRDNVVIGALYSNQQVGVTEGTKVTRKVANAFAVRVTP